MTYSKTIVRILSEAKRPLDIKSLLPDIFEYEDDSSQILVRPDDHLRGYMDEIYIAIDLIDKISLDEVIHAVEAISEEADSDENISEAGKAAVQSVASIAMGSTQLWLSAREDPGNVFYAMHAKNLRRRRLNMDGMKDENDGKVNLFQNISFFIAADVIGAIRGAFLPTSLFLVGLSTPTRIATMVTRSALTNSLAAIGIIIPSVMEVFLCLANLAIFSNCDF